MSHRAAVGLSHQGAFTPNPNGPDDFHGYSKEWGKPELVGALFKGSELLGCPLKAPLAKYDIVYTLPLTTISMVKGTGVVTSVPSDAPDDWIALHELKTDEKLRNKYGIEEKHVQFDVVPIINIPSRKVEKEDREEGLVVGQVRRVLVRGAQDH